jgi:hypothetical protein
VKDEYAGATLWDALAVIQRDAPVILKTEEVDTRPDGGKMHYSFAGLNTVWSAIAGLMDDLGLIWVTCPDVLTLDGGQSRFVLRYSLLHRPSGEAITGSYPLAGDSPQKRGGEITFARRYALVAVLNLRVAGDDDEAQASEDRAAMSPSQQAQQGRAPRKAAQRTQPRPRQAPPQTPDVAPAEGPRMMSDDQRKKLFAAMGEAGVGNERQHYQAYINETLASHGAEPVESSTKLTFEQAGWVIERAERAAGGPPEEG